MAANPDPADLARQLREMPADHTTRHQAADLIERLAAERDAALRATGPTGGVSLSPSLTDDPLAIGAILDDQRRHCEIRDRVLLQIRNVLGEDGHRVSLDDLPSLVESQVRAAGPTPAREERERVLDEVQREIEQYLYTNTKNGNRAAMLNIVKRLREHPPLPPTPREEP